MKYDMSSWFIICDVILFGSQLLTIIWDQLHVDPHRWEWYVQKLNCVIDIGIPRIPLSMTKEITRYKVMSQYGQLQRGECLEGSALQGSRALPMGGSSRVVLENLGIHNMRADPLCKELSYFHRRDVQRTFCQVVRLHSLARAFRPSTLPIIQALHIQLGNNKEMWLLPREALLENGILKSNYFQLLNLFMEPHWTFIELHKTLFMTFSTHIMWVLLPLKRSLHNNASSAKHMS